MVLLVVAGGAAWFFSKHLPTSFLPDEDQGYLYINMQLPKAASMERTSAAAKQVEDVLAKHAGSSVHHQRHRFQSAQLRPNFVQRILLGISETLG